VTVSAFFIVSSLLSCF